MGWQHNVRGAILLRGFGDRDGVWVTNEKVVTDLFVDFYAQLFTSSNLIDLERVLAMVHPVVDESMNAALTKPYV